MSGDGSRSASSPRSGPGGGSGAAPSEDGAGARAENSALLHVLLNLAFMAGCVYLYRAAGELPDSRWEPLGSGTFPRIVLATLILLNLVMVVTKLGQARVELREHGHAFGRIVGETLRESLLVIATFALFGVFLVAIAPLGFVLSAFLFILALQLLLATITVRGVIVAVLVAIVTAFGVDYTFEAYFNVYLPPGWIWR